MNTIRSEVPMVLPRSSITAKVYDEVERQLKDEWEKEHNGGGRIGGLR
jgi:hypothetical protein